MASQKIQGLNIKLSADTSAIDQALKDVNKSLNSTQKELNDVNRLLKMDPANVTLLTQKQGLLTESINKTKLKLEEYNKIKELADNDDSVDKSTQEYRELERQIESTRQKLAKLQEQQENNNETLEKANKGLKNVGDNALSVGDIIKGNLLSNVIIGGIKGLASAFVSLGTSAYNLVRDTGLLADDINTLSAQYNLSTKEIQQYMKASELIDVDINTITKSMAKLTKNMTSTSKETTGAFKKLGVAVTENNGELRDSNVVFTELLTQLEQIQNETEQDSLAMAIFGKSAAELGTLINGSAEQLAEFNKYLEENNLLLSQEELDNLNDMNDSFDVLKATLDSVKEKVASQIAPIITPIVEMLTQFIVDHKDELVQLVEDLITKLTGDDGQKLFDNISKLVEDIEDFIDYVPTLIQDIKDIATALKPLLDVVVAIVKAIAYIIENIDKISKGNGNLSTLETSGSWGHIQPLVHSGGYGSIATLQSGGFASGGVTLNANFSITNGNNINESTVKSWAKVMVNQINEELGGMM